MLSGLRTYVKSVLVLPSDNDDDDDDDDEDQPEDGHELHLASLDEVSPERECGRVQVVYDALRAAVEGAEQRRLASSAAITHVVMT